MMKRKLVSNVPIIHLNLMNIMLLLIYYNKPDDLIQQKYTSYCFKFDMSVGVKIAHNCWPNTAPSIDGLNDYNTIYIVLHVV